MHIDIKQEVLEAEARIRSHIRETPIEYSPYLSRIGNCNAYLKLENCQITGSFKLRGALNKYLSLSPEKRNRGIITASSGNHGAAIAYVLQKFMGTGVIFLPENASRAKLGALQMAGAEIAQHGNDCVMAEKAARDEAQRSGKSFISPYNDPKIIGGQGTIALELKDQLKKIDTMLIPVGGGGLISGLAGYMKETSGGIEIIGCQPENSPVMAESVKEGKILDMESKPTISDGTAGGLEPDSITFEMCRKYVDDFLLVSEEEIRSAIRLMIEKHQILVEGAAALSIASLIKAKRRFQKREVVLLVTGKKISLDLLRSLIQDPV
ncbi:MAG: threonine/serine dehydratase [Deltaproteobacteria bacterium]|nr:threonine/serine dehydratase [Deltaproteobacteria bacterium]MBW2130661.1 threonine/serine dehydratase [Deltaproteobacteria bacterium]MBW2304677.1 threonine/serine dehydratase [Deltaproteobacteria bacterium]